MALLLFVFAMFGKISKNFGSKAADSAVEGVKETLNDKLESYSGIIKIGLVLSVIIFGGTHLIKPKEEHGPYVTPYSQPMRLPGAGQPIIINNYYHEPKGDRWGNERTERQKQTYQKYQGRR